MLKLVIHQLTLVKLNVSQIDLQSDQYYDIPSGFHKEQGLLGKIK